MSNLKPYPEYKDSGVPWLGEIPSHWETLKLKFSMSNISQKENAIETDLRYFGLENIESNTGKLINDIELVSEGIGNIFENGDVLFGKLRPYLAKVYLTTGKGLVSTEAFVLRAFDFIYPKFLFYYCLSPDFVDQVNGTTFGSKMPRANWENISNFLICYPEIKEQKIIVNFLDRKLHHIDTLINKQEQLIEKLTEQRSAIITQAVTKGLDPNVPMKNSGIEWLGEIPEHWNVKPIRFLFQFKNNIRTPISGEQRSFMKDRNYPYYGASGIIDFVESFLFDEDLILVAEDGANLLSRSSALAFVARGKYWVNNHAHILKPLDDKLNYWEYVLSIYDFTPNITGSAQPKMTKDNLASIKLPIPPELELESILIYLNSKVKNINHQILKIKTLLPKLKEYRSALITQAVTGKIDVRNMTENIKGVA